MGKFRVEIKAEAEKQIAQHYKSGNRGSIKKIQKILQDLIEHPFEGEGNPEPLKYELGGFWSRRINQKDRLVYFVEAEIVTVFVISAMGHYTDK